MGGKSYIVDINMIYCMTFTPSNQQIFIEISMFTNFFLYNCIFTNTMIKCVLKIARMRTRPN